MIQWISAIWSLVPLPFLNPTWTYRSSRTAQPHLEHCFSSMWNESNCAVVWTFFGVAFGIGMKSDLFQSCGHCWVFQICWHSEYSISTASSFRVWSSSTGIPSPPLALFVVTLCTVPLTSHSRCLALGQWSHHRDYLGCEDLFCTVLLCILAISS